MSEQEPSQVPPQETPAAGAPPPPPARTGMRTVRAERPARELRTALRRLPHRLRHPRRHLPHRLRRSPTRRCGTLASIAVGARLLLVPRGRPAGSDPREDGARHSRHRLLERRPDRLRARRASLRRPHPLPARVLPRLPLDALGQGEADLARQDRDHGRRAGRELPGSRKRAGHARPLPLRARIQWNTARSGPLPGSLSGSSICSSRDSRMVRPASPTSRSFVAWSNPAKNIGAPRKSSTKLSCEPLPPKVASRRPSLRSHRATFARSPGSSAAGTCVSDVAARPRRRTTRARSRGRDVAVQELRAGHGGPGALDLRPRDVDARQTPRRGEGRRRLHAGAAADLEHVRAFGKEREEPVDVVLARGSSTICAAHSAYRSAILS